MEQSNHFSDFINEVSLQAKIENIWSNTCGSWQNVNEQSIRSFLSQCQDYNLDPLYCMGWIEQHKDQVSNWAVVSSASLNWINEHTSTGTPLLDSSEQLL